MCSPRYNSRPLHSKIVANSMHAECHRDKRAFTPNVGYTMIHSPTQNTAPSFDANDSGNETYIWFTYVQTVELRPPRAVLSSNLILPERFTKIHGSPILESSCYSTVQNPSPKFMDIAAEHIILKRRCQFSSWISCQYTANVTNRSFSS